MELIFLIALLAVVVYLNRSIFGFGPKGCDWMSADAPAEDGTLKWRCNTCGKIETTADGQKPANCERAG